MSAKADLQASRDRMNALFQTLRDCENTTPEVDAILGDFALNTEAFVARWDARRRERTAAEGRSR